MVIPYSVRVGALVALAVVVVLYDRLRRQGKGASRLEYGLLFLAGAFGAVYGAVNDAITSHISPQYFILWKGFDEGDSLTTQAMVLGAEAGFSAGAIACAIWQFALRATPAQQRCLAILRFVWVPFASAGVLSVGLPLIFGHVDPFSLAVRFDGVVSGDDLARFLTVWWAHLGSYTGLCVGVLAGILLTRKNHSVGCGAESGAWHKETR